MREIQLFTIRPALVGDISFIADIEAETLKETTDAPPAHLREEVLDFYTRKIFGICALLVADVSGTVVGYTGFRKDWIEHLRVRSQYHRLGIGKALLNYAKEIHPYLQLWCFQHIPARNFYKSQGFLEVEFTDGAENDEKLPDVRMEWRRSFSA
ncbi:MAG: GNAT family N-acetyltransferase [Methylocella sp.]